MANTNYPTYKTEKGNPVKAYVAEAIGKWFSIDGGENNYQGTNGTIGSYATAEEAIRAATKEKDETCTVRVLNTRAEDGVEEIFKL